MVYLRTDIAPCSFLNYIFINPNQYDPETFRQIVEHEKIHASQGHSLDMMLAELLIVVQWFNPAAWMLRKAIINNLEFLTDNTMLSKGVNRVSYQLNLLKVATPNYNGFLVNNYNSSVLKKRISMMNRHASSLTAGWKYIALAFTILGSVMALDAMKKALAKDTWVAEVDGNEVYLSFDPADWNDGHTYEAIAETWVLPGFNEEYTDRFKLERDAGSIFFTGSLRDGDGQGEFVFEPNRSFRSYLEEAADGYPSDETLFRMTISNIGQRYISFLQENGYADLHIYQLCELAAAQVPLEYLESILPQLKARNIDPIPLELLIEINRQDIDGEFIELIAILEETGYNHLDSDQLIQLMFEAADGELRNILRALHESGYQEFSSDQIMHMSRQNVDDELSNILNAIQETGYSGFTPDQIMNMSLQEVDEELSNILWAMHETGFRDFTPDQIMNMSMQQVDDELSKILWAMHETGYRDLSSDQVMNMSIQYVADELKTILHAMHETDYRDLTSDQIMNMSVQQVADELKTILWAMHETGYRSFTSDQVMNMSVQFVSEELKSILWAIHETGFRDFTPEQLMLLSVQEASHEFENVVRLLNETGYRAFSSEQIVTLCLNDRNEELDKLIRVLKVTGNNGLSTDQLIELSEVMRNW